MLVVGVLLGLALAVVAATPVRKERPVPIRVRVDRRR